MTKLDELMLTGKWLDAIRHVREINNQRGKIGSLGRSLLYVALRAYHLGILHTAPARIRQDATIDVRTAA